MMIIKLKVRRVYQSFLAAIVMLCATMTACADGASIACIKIVTDNRVNVIGIPKRNIPLYTSTDPYEDIIGLIFRYGDFINVNELTGKIISSDEENYLKIRTSIDTSNPPFTYAHLEREKRRGASVIDSKILPGFWETKEIRGAGAPLPDYNFFPQKASSVMRINCPYLGRNDLEYLSKIKCEVTENLKPYYVEYGIPFLSIRKHEEFSKYIGMIFTVFEENGRKCADFGKPQN